MIREFLVYDENEAGHTLKMDDAQLCVCIDDKQKKLSPKEYRFLAALAERVNEVAAREKLIAQAEDAPSGMDSRIVDVYMLRLRKKLGVNCIQTVVGSGYRLSGVFKDE